MTSNPADDSPSWSPNGKQIVFQSKRDGNREIYIMNDDGSGQTRLTNTPADENYFSLSPDGKHIIFSDNSSEDINYINVMNIDGTEQTRLTNTGKDWNPFWRR
jgi:TolB protein